jgi:hypothetical protein
MGAHGRRRSVGWLVLFGGVLCATSSEVLYGPLYLLGVIAPGVSAQALLGIGLAACWAVGVIGVSWLIAPYRPRTSARWLCVVAATLTMAAALTASPAVRVMLLCVGAGGGALSSQALSAVRRRAPEGRGGVAMGRASAVWFALIAGVPFVLSWVVAHAGLRAGLWALSGLALISVGLVGLVIDRGRLPGGRVSWRAQLTIARQRDSGVVIVILMLSGGATVAGQTYGVLEAVRLGFAPQWLAPAVLLGVPAAAVSPRFAARSPRYTMLVILGLAAAGFVAGAGTDLLDHSPQVRVYGVIAAFVLIQVSASGLWSAGQIIGRPQRSAGDEQVEGAIRQSAPFACQALIGLGLLPLWLTCGWSATCLAALVCTTASMALLTRAGGHQGRHRCRKVRLRRSSPAVHSEGLNGETGPRWHDARQRAEVLVFDAPAQCGSNDLKEGR